jgi:DNA-binding NtrC family response regulator
VILVVEDEPMQRDDLQWACEGEGRNIWAAGTAEEARRLIGENEFDVVVTDLRMKTEEASLDVLRAAKEKDIYTQVIMVTAYGTPEVSVSTMKLGAFDYIERNTPGVEFLATVQSMVSLALELRRQLLQSGRKPDA